MGLDIQDGVIDTEKGMIMEAASQQRLSSCRVVKTLLWPSYSYLNLTMYKMRSKRQRHVNNLVICWLFVSITDITNGYPLS